MSQTSQLVDMLKKILRERKITYSEVASHLDLSEANVKRMFSKRHFTLSRLEEVCTLANIDLGFLMARMIDDSAFIQELPLDTEKTLVGNIKLLIIAQLLINRWEISDITDTYDFEDLEVTRLLAQLDRLGIIELLPGNRVRNLVSRDFKWIHNGPAYKFFEKHVANEFFQSKFDPKSGELLIFIAGRLSKANNAHMHQNMRRLAKDFDELCKEDSKLTVEETYGTGFVLALRPWEMSVFAEHRRRPNTKKFKT